MMEFGVKLQFKFRLSCGKEILRGAGTSPLATSSPEAISFVAQLLIITKIRDKSKRF